MQKEIRRNNWAQFLKKFNAANQYRTMNISIREKKNKRTINSNMPLLGMALEKKGRLIDGVQLFTGRGDTESITERVISIKHPDKIILEKDEQGADRRILVSAGDGIEAIVELGDRDTTTAENLVRRVAYSMYEKRGRTPGYDLEDWLTAEKKVKNTELTFLR
jgi:hypothetical protein